MAGVASTGVQLAINLRSTCAGDSLSAEAEVLGRS